MKLILRNAAQLKQLQEQILLEQQEAANWQQQQEVPPPPQEAPPPPPPAAPPSPPLPPPPSYQELETSASMQTSTFNYARPKQFIAAQVPGALGGGVLGGGGYAAARSSGSSGSSLSSPLSPPASHKAFSRVTLPPFSKTSSLDSPSSPSFPPPPPPFLSPSGDLYLSSMLPSSPCSPMTPSSPGVNALGLPRGNGTVYGSKDAVIQDLERKLRFKEERLGNGQQRLTYEEKMARRLLGADSAATVLHTQDTQEEETTLQCQL
ncbi:hypothetical protein CRUP_035003 [Coryphaenoides rupestris]|nr:hypothetical protein CRUP_035003 [Coryphaenoides rupestris]